MLAYLLAHLFTFWVNLFRNYPPVVEFIINNKPRKKIKTPFTFYKHVFLKSLGRKKNFRRHSYFWAIIVNKFPSILYYKRKRKKIECVVIAGNYFHYLLGAIWLSRLPPAKFLWCFSRFLRCVTKVICR